MKLTESYLSYTFDVLYASARLDKKVKRKSFCDLVTCSFVHFGAKHVNVIYVNES